MKWEQIAGADRIIGNVNIAQASEPAHQQQLRLWPGVALAVLLLLFKFVVPIVVPGAVIIVLLGSLGCALAIPLWWLFLSRARWSERVGALLLMIVALFGTSLVLHASLGKGQALFVFIGLALPTLGVALVVWAIATRGLSDGLRRTTMASTILIAVGGWASVRVGGLTNDFKSDLHWRWTQTPEERLLAQPAHEPLALPAAPEAAPATPAVTPAPAKAAPATAVPPAPNETPVAAGSNPRGPRLPRPPPAG